MENTLMSSARQSSGNPANTTVFKAELLAQSGLFKGMHKGMAITSALLVLLFVLFTGVNTEFAGSFFGATKNWIELTFG